MPSFSSSMLSWKLHDEQLPQSPRASSAALVVGRDLLEQSFGAGWLALFLARNLMFSTWRCALSLSRIPPSSSRALGLELEIRAMASVFQLTGFSATFSPRWRKRRSSDCRCAWRFLLSSSSGSPRWTGRRAGRRRWRRPDNSAPRPARRLRRTPSASRCGPRHRPRYGPEASRASESGRNSAAGDWPT